MFDIFISLGWNCLNASSMQMTGMREFSGPFDWIWSDFEQVIRCIDNDFVDFLEWSNIRYEANSPRRFEEIKYKMFFFHDVEVSVEEEYEIIYAKYMKRIGRFRNEIKKKTCFIRLIKNQEELDWINADKNVEYINRVLKKSNQKNEIIYLIPKMCSGEVENSRCFGLNIFDNRAFWGDYTRNAYTMNPRLIRWLEENSSKEKRNYNLQYNFSKEKWQETDVSNLILHINNLQDWYGRATDRYQRLLLLEVTDFEKIKLPENVIIYGLGEIGKLFYQKLKHKCKVEYFIDSFSNECQYEGIPIRKLEKVQDSQKKIIVVVPEYDYEIIEDSLREFYDESCKIVRMREFISTHDI